MPTLEITVLAVAQLERMIELYELPADTRARATRSATHLQMFPESGVALAGNWDGHRLTLGPWPWMLLIHSQISDDRVVIVSIEDSRSANAATNQTA